MISGFCTAINPIDFTLWTSFVLMVGMLLGILLSTLCSRIVVIGRASNSKGSETFPSVSAPERNKQEKSAK